MNDKRYNEIIQDIRDGKQARELENKYGELISTHDLFWLIRLLIKRYVIK